MPFLVWNEMQGMKMEAMTHKAAKDQNAVRLFTVLAINLFTFIWMFLDWEISMESLRYFIFGPLAVAATAIINGMIGPETKAKIVFLRWKNPSPETRVFSDLIAKDGRIDIRRIDLEIKGASSFSAEKQNVAWFDYYLHSQTNPLVVSCERNYVYYRDYACMLILFALTALTASFYFRDHLNLILICLLILAVQYAFVAPVAARSGNEFATTVIAVSFVKKFKKRKRLSDRSEKPTSSSDGARRATLETKDKKFSDEQKMNAARRVVNGESLVEVARDIGAPIVLLRRWSAEFKRSPEYNHSDRTPGGKKEKVT